MRKISFMVMVCSFFVLTGVVAAFADELKISGGAPAIEYVFKPIKEPFEKATGIKLNLLAVGPKTALIDLEKGDIDAAAGPAFNDWMNFMKKEGAEVKDPASLQHIVVGKDKIVAIVHKDNPITSLTKEQVKGIFTGKIINWKDVGGNDMPVMVVLGKLISPANNIFFKHMLDGEAAMTDVLEVSTAGDVRQTVASNPEAIGIVSHIMVDATVKSPETPEAPITFTLVTKTGHSPKVQKLIDFIKTDGSKYIK